MKIKTKETKNFNGVIISSDFECGSGTSFQELNKHHFRTRIPADPPNPAGGDYRWYFCVKITNTRKTKTDFILDALRLDSNECDWKISKAPVFASEDFEAWQLLPGIQVTPNFDYKFSIILNPGQTIYVSNSLPHRYKTMFNWLKQVQSAHSEISQLTTIGQSVQSRDIFLLSISEIPDKSDREKERFLITSGFHPAEPDWLATTSIIEKLLSNEPWIRDARQRYIFDIITQFNPDGFALGTNGCNSNGINPYWDFRPYDYKNSPETAHLWKWIKKHHPIIYLDFHCYVHNMRKDYQPYLKPLSDYHHPAIRHIVSELDNKLLALSQGRAMRGKLTNLPSTLAYQITAKYDTITYTKYHLHLKHGFEHCRKLGLSVFKTVVEGIKPYKNISHLQFERTSKNFGWFLRVHLRAIKNYFFKGKKRINKKRKSIESWRPKFLNKEIRKISKQNLNPNNKYTTRVKTYKTYKEYIYNQMEKTLNIKTRKMCEKIRKERIEEFYKMFKKSLKLVDDKICALCIGARYGEEVEAAQKIFNKVEAIDLVEYPPLVKVGDMHNLEFPDQTFDLVYTNSLDHSFNPHRVIEECYRVLKTKGIFVVDIKYRDKGIYEVIRFDDEDNFKNLFNKYFKLVKEESLNTSKILFGLSNRYFWRKN